MATARSVLERVTSICLGEPFQYALAPEPFDFTLVPEGAIDIPRIKDELENFFIEQAEGKEQKQEILNSRKLRGFENRLQRERQGLEIVATEQEVLKRALQQEGLQAIEEIEQALSKDCGEQATRCDELKKRIANLKYQAQQLEHQYLREDLSKCSKEGARKSFKKKWDAEKIIRLITDPTNDEFQSAGPVVAHLSDDIKDQWQKAADKRANRANRWAHASIKQQSRCQITARLRPAFQA